MTTYLGKSCSFGFPRVPFVNCRQFMYLVISLLVLRAGCGIWLYQFLIIAYPITLKILPNSIFSIFLFCSLWRPIITLHLVSSLGNITLSIGYNIQSLPFWESGRVWLQIWRSALIKRIFNLRLALVPNIRKKQTILKIALYLFKYPIMYIYQDILVAKKVLFCVIKGLFHFKRKNLSHWFRRI